jgi:Right handed beta helix region
LANPTKYRHFDKLQIGQTVCEGTSIAANTISSSGDAGVGLSSAVGTIVKGNRIDRSGLRGVDMIIWAAGGVQPPCGTIVEGNLITAPNTTADGAAYQAVGAQQTTDFQIINNRCGGALATTGYFHAIGMLGCSGFVVERNVISDAYANGIRVDAASDWVSRMGRISGNQITRCYGEGLLMWGGLNLVVDGNIITGSAANNGPGGFGGALNVRGVKDSVFKANQVIDNGRGVGLDDATVQGVVTTTTGNKFIANVVVDTGKNFDPFSGATTQQNYGFKELGGTPSGNQFLDNVVKGNQTNWSITSTGNTLRGNTNYNPVGKFGSQPAVPASTVAQTNDRNADATVFITGGTVTAVAIGGQATGLTAGAFRVPAGQSITVTYSVAPTWVWFGD